MLPRVPYRGIESFRYSDHQIFFARDAETRELLRLVVVFRGVLLYGESGSGKSSLINAGLFPTAAAEGFRADRVRVQPREGEELVIERVSVSEAGDAVLPSTFSREGGDSSQIVLSVDDFYARLAALSDDEPWPLLIFDQFEELITLFEEAPVGAALQQAREAQQRIVDMLGRILRDGTLRVKLLFGFREDYLAKVKKLLERHPDLVSQSMRLTPPGVGALPRIIRGPFEDYTGHFGRELSEELAERLTSAIEQRSTSGTINLSEVQIVCLRLWESSDPDALLETEDIEGILVEYLEESLRRFPQELHDPAVALLSQMVTATGARNVIAAADLVERVRKDEPDIAEDQLKDALKMLENDTKLIRREQRHDLNLYEISSEFLVPWIERQRSERLKARELAELEQQLEEQRRRQRAMYKRAIVASVLLLVSVAFGLIALFSYIEAEAEREKSRSRSAAFAAALQLPFDPLAAVDAAFKARDIHPTMEAEEALRSALVESHQRAVLEGHSGTVHAAAFSADGKRVVTVGEDMSARLWNADSGNAVLRRGHEVVLPHHGQVLGASFSPDGRRVVTASTDGLARVWDLKSGKEAVVLRHRAQVLGASFSPDGKRVVTASTDGLARVWDLKSGTAAVVFRHDLLSEAGFSPDGRRVLTASADGTARVWEVRTGRMAAVLPQNRLEPVVGASFHPDGTRVVTASRDGTITVWTAAGDRLRSAPLGDGVNLEVAAFSPNGRFVTTARGDGAAEVWDVATGELVSVLRGHDGPIDGASFSPDGTRLVTAGTDGTARVWESSVYDSVILAGRAGRLNSAVFNSARELVATVGANGTGRIRSVAPRSNVQVSLGKAISNVSFSRGGEFVVTVDREGGARIWDVATWRSTRISLPSRHMVFSATIDPDGGRLALTGVGATLWSLNGPGSRAELIKELVEPDPFFPAISVAAFSADGKRLVTLAGNEVSFWDARTGSDLGSTGTRIEETPASVAFTPAGLLVTAHDDGTARLWNVEEPEAAEQVLVLQGHTERINDAHISRDGLFVVTASDDRTARVWESGSGRLLAVLRGHADAVRTAEFSSDGTRIWTASADGVLRQFTCEPCLPLEDLIQLGNWDEDPASESESSE